MNMQSIIITDMMGVVILVILMISSNLIRQRRTPSDRVFTIMCVLTALSCIADMFAFMVDGQQYEGAYATAMFLNTFTYSTNIIVSALWMLYVDFRLYGNNLHMIRTLKRTFLPGAIGLIGIIVNLKWPFIYTLDSENIYHRLPFSTFYFCLTYFYLISSVIIRYSHRKRMGRTRFVPVWLFLTPIICCTTVQFINYGISLAWCSVSIGLVSLHMGLQNELVYLDPLTKIYNRNYLNHLMKHYSYVQTEVFGIMLDLDHFKSINDTYGHDAGDEALIESSNILVSSVQGHAIPIRFAGDEFVILMPSSTKEELEQIIHRIREKELEFNQSEKKPYKLLFSMGTARLSTAGSVEQFLKEMDNRMYEQKRIRHKQNAYTTR